VHLAAELVDLQHEGWGQAAGWLPPLLGATHAQPHTHTHTHLRLHVGHVQPKKGGLQPLRRRARQLLLAAPQQVLQLHVLCQLLQLWQQQLAAAAVH
jgi:hypothetical protein